MFENRTKFPTNCGAHLAESLFQTRFREKNRDFFAIFIMLNER
ncbi:MAG: DUF6783 domain-containing protein [Ruminococcus sp.]